MTQIIQDDQIQIQRCPHDAENPYTMVRNELIRDSSLSPNCRWLLIYLLSNQKDWVIKFAQVASHVKDFIGRDTLYSVFDEAIEAGYIKREKYTVSNLTRYRYIVSETPKFKKFLRCPEMQDTGPQDPGIQGSKEGTSKEKTSKERTLDKKNISRARKREKKDDAKENVREFVRLSKEEHEKLKNLYTQNLLDAMLDELNAYKGSSGKKYDSDYHTMTKRGWVSEKIIKEFQNTQNPRRDSNAGAKPNNSNHTDQNREQVFKPRFHYSVGGNS